MGAISMIRRTGAGMGARDRMGDSTFDRGMERRSLLSEILHPALIPLPPSESLPRGHEDSGAYSVRGSTPSLSDLALDEGVSLDRLLRQLGGAPLPSWRRRCPGGISMLLTSFVNIARLLCELKGAGWEVHRLHPRMIRLGSDGVLRLSAIDLIEGCRELTSEERAPYLAPEILLAVGGGHRAGEEAGVYALAAILNHCLAGAPPWSGRTEAEVADRILAAVPPSSIPDEKDVPRGVAPLLVESLSLDPRQRPARYRGFAAALESAARGGRPRPANHQLRPTPIRSQVIVRLLLLVCLTLAFVSWVRTGSSERERQETISRLNSALEARPYPLHGEDPLEHPLGRQVLRESWDQAAQWPRDPEVLISLGWAQLRAGEPEAAVDTFARALHWSSEDSGASISLGIARLELGDRSGELDLNRGLAVAPTTSQGRRVYALGLLYLHRFAEAEAAFRQVVELDGPSNRAVFHLALAAHYSGNGPVAESALTEAELLSPHDVWNEWLRVERLVLAGQAEEALQRIESRKSEWIESPALLVRGAVILRRLEQMESAEEWSIRASAAGKQARGPVGVAPFDEVHWSPKGLLVFPTRRLLD